MVYYGAEDYYFWQGVKWGQEYPDTLRDVLSALNEELPLDMAMVTKCRDAATEGFLWGLILTSDEYNDMMTIVKKEEPVVEPEETAENRAKEVEEIIIKINQEYPFKGNC